MIWPRFIKWVKQSPGREAVAAPSRRWTYGELSAAAERLSARLVRDGIRVGDSLAFFLPNGFDFVATFLAAARSGCVSVPLNVNYQTDEMIDYLRHSRPRIVLTDAKRRERLHALLHRLESPPRLMVMEDAGADSKSDIPPAAAVGPDHFVLCQYSTGSTGQPKPVKRTQEQLIAEADHFARAVKVGPDDRILAVVPLFHAHGFGNAMLAALMNGAAMVVLESFNPRDVLSALEREKITLYPGVPFMFKLMTETRLTHRPDLSRLRLAFSAGAALDPEVGRNFQGVFGVYVRQLYGSTETGSVTINLDPDIEATLESVGRAMAPAEAAVFDESGNRLPPGETGEVGIRSPAMTSGYDGMPEATAASFRNGFFFPGDLGRLDENGRLYITGRKTFFINVGGNKVDPAEVERVIAAHPKVKDVVVLGVKAPYGGEFVKAVVVPREPCQASEILEACQGRLAEYKLPKSVEFRDEIQRSPLGKVLRKYLV